MKKMLIVLPKMSMGGMERSAVNLLNLSNYSKDYDVTLLVGYIVDDSLFKNLPENVKVKVLYKGKWNIVGKFITAIKYIGLYIKMLLKKNSYDVAICYSHHHGVLAKLTRIASKNSIGFVHNDLNLSRTQKQIDKLKFEKFSRIVCVSEAAKKAFMEKFPNYLEQNIFVINNYIDGERILKLAEEKCEEKIDNSKTIFINIARHLEPHKKISRILKAAKKLKEENYEFSVVLVGDGPDTEKYKEYVEKNKLGDVVSFLGNRPNPYNYLKKSNAFVFSSSFEGYGMVLDEARVLNIPIITTDVADAKIITAEGYGLLCENSDEGVYAGMKSFLASGYNIKEKFDYTKFNEVITERLDKLANF